MGRTARAAVAVVVIAVVAAALDGCGSGRMSAPLGNRIEGNHLTIYVSVPQDGDSAGSGRAVVDGAQMALDHIGGRIGRYRIAMKVLDDSSKTTMQWNQGQTELAAHTAIADPTTIGYLGDFNSGASAISIPLLNRFAIPQVSPASTAVGLTSNAIGSEIEEPQAYYPTTRRTFAGVVPNDLVQAEVQLELQRSLGCRSTYVLYDNEYDGEETNHAFVELASKRGFPVIDQEYVPSASSYVSDGQTVAQSGANCVMIAAIPDTNAARLVTQVAAEVPDARLFATFGLAESSFTNPADGGIPTSLDHRLLVTAAAGDPGVANAEARAFEAGYQARFGTPELVAIDGYEAMSLLLTAIRRATRDGHRQAQRVEVVSALFATRGRHSVLGTYSIDRDGDTTLNQYGVYRVVDGNLRFWKALSG